MASVKELDALLPQTQCGECGYAGCLPYAEALARGAASINLCPPGGEATVKALATLLQVDSAPYLVKEKPPTLAKIREAECIGCTKCIQACPVDAILGSAKSMHTILDTECTGCGLCVDPCPVDCIDMVSVPALLYDKNTARRRFHAKKIRALRQEHESQEHYKKKSHLTHSSEGSIQDIQAKQAYIQQALDRVKAKKKYE